MCWCSRKLKPLQADKDILVRKIVTNANGIVCSSLYQKFVYAKDQTQSMRGKLEPYHANLCGPYMIFEGFHSYSKSCVIKTIYTKIGPPEPPYITVKFGRGVLDTIKDIELVPIATIADFIIPKGATYLYNNRGEYVSDKIKFVGLTKV